jgi:hypothetical protein
MNKISLKRLKNFPESGANSLEFENEIYAIHKNNHIILSKEGSEDTIFSLIDQDNKLYLFQDNNKTCDTEIRINGKRISLFSILLANKNVITIYQNQNLIGEILTSRDHIRLKQATQKKCGYCFQTFDKNEQVFLIDKNEYHKECGIEINELSGKI